MLTIIPCFRLLQMQPGRLQNTELVVPIIVGTVSQHLGKKVRDHRQQHSKHNPWPLVYCIKPLPAGREQLYAVLAALAGCSATTAAALLSCSYSCSLSPEHLQHQTINPKCSITYVSTT
jgi:hypothetical protein